MTHHTRTLAISAAGIMLSGCALLPGRDTGPSICDADERTELFALDLGEADSPAFEVTDDIQVFVAVTSDPLYDPNAFDLFPGIAAVYFRPADAEPKKFTSKYGATYAVDPFLKFDDLNTYEPLLVEPGEYRLYASDLSRPRVDVVSCPA